MKCIEKGPSSQNPTDQIYLVDAEVPIIEWFTQDSMDLINFNNYIEKAMYTKKVRRLSDNECSMKLDLHAALPQTPLYCTETDK